MESREVGSGFVFVSTNDIKNLLISSEKPHITSISTTFPVVFQGYTDHNMCSFPLPKCRFFTNLPQGNCGDNIEDQEMWFIKRLCPSYNIHQLKKCTKEGSEEKDEDQKQNADNLQTPIIIGKPLAWRGGKSGLLNREAKRGHQTMNSHSLAERVRRERINERMRFLQDLVPGCNKITGRALMLDEIINYVQSLQRQLEFLSMKLAAVYSEMEVFDMEPLCSQDTCHSKSEKNLMS